MHGHKGLGEEITTAAKHNVTFKVVGASDCPGYMTAVDHSVKYGVIVIQEW